jgi:hypothetical protein
LSLVCRGSDEGLSEVLHSQLANTGADAKSFHSIGPEELVTEERLDNGRNSRWRQTLVTNMWEAGIAYLGDWHQSFLLHHGDTLHLSV